MIHSTIKWFGCFMISLAGTPLLSAATVEEDCSAPIIANSSSPGPNTNSLAFAAMKADGSVTVWGYNEFGGHFTQSSNGYNTLTMRSDSFAALSADGSLTQWGGRSFISPSTPIPEDSGYTRLYSNPHSYAALKSDGSISAWGESVHGGNGAPSDSGYISITANQSGYAALRADGSVLVWPETSYLYRDAPTDKGYKKIVSNSAAFAGLKEDGSIYAWGREDRGLGEDGEPQDMGYVAIANNAWSFVALKNDGSVFAWGSDDFGGVDAPTDSGYVHIAANSLGYAGLKDDGSIVSWGASTIQEGTPVDNGYSFVRGFNQSFGGTDGIGSGFIAIKPDGSLFIWGNRYDGTNTPTGTGYTAVVHNSYAFAALSDDGSITTWGHSEYGGSGAPSGSGYVTIVGNTYSFAALHEDGSIVAWGNNDFFTDEGGTGGINAPTDIGYVSINGISAACFRSLHTIDDFDKDGIPDTEERTNGTNPYHRDSDIDGISDKAEGIADTDNDGKPDALESSRLDADADGVPDQQDRNDSSGSNDSDGDGVSNTDETIAGTDPLDPDSFPGNSDAISLQVSAILQGAYDVATGLMSDNLRTKNLIPSVQPYVDGTTNTDENGNSLSPDILSRTGSAAPVDWVSIDLLADDRETRLANRTGLILRDGRVVDALTEKAVLKFPLLEAGNYYVVIRHRNHLAVMTENQIALNNMSTAIVDFRQPTTPTFGDNAQHITGSKAMLWAGDANGNNNIIANGPDNDIGPLLATVLMDIGNEAFNSNYHSKGYHQTDYNMDGASLFAGPGNDITLIISNVLTHPYNTTLSTNYILQGTVPE